MIRTYEYVAGNENQGNWAKAKGGGEGRIDIMLFIICASILLYGRV